jgi:hypothetical protein
MSIDHTAILPQEVKELVRKRINEMTEELRTKYDPGFRPGVYVQPVADRDGLPDGFWIVFPPIMTAELAYSFMEAGHETMRKFIESGIIERLKVIRKDRQKPTQSPNGNLHPHRVQSPEEKSLSDR